MYLFTLTLRQEHTDANLTKIDIMLITSVLAYKINYRGLK